MPQGKLRQQELVGCYKIFQDNLPIEAGDFDTLDHALQCYQRTQKV